MLAALRRKIGNF